MKFPTWVEKTRSKRDKAALRLRFLIDFLVLHRYRSNTLIDLAKEAGCSHTVLIIYSARGYFTRPMAEKVSAVFGADVLPVSYLTDPLTIPQGD